MTIQIFSSGFAIGQTNRLCLNRKSNFTCGGLSILYKQKIRKMIKKIVTIGFLMQNILGWIVDCDDFFYHFSDSFLQKLPLSQIGAKEIKYIYIQKRHLPKMAS
jgi:hypothetical protein